MAFRTFLDRDGNEWLAFDVVPRKNERRAFDRRSGRSERRSIEDHQSDDRRDHDRRLTVGGGGLLSGSTEGWLCFERGDDRRRLTPIPGDWRRCSEEQLEAYRQSAIPARRESTDLTESSTRHL